MDSKWVPGTGEGVSAHFSQIGQEKKGREGEGRVYLKLPLSELVEKCFLQQVFAYIDSFYYD